jgi:hypothetical protein
MASNGKAVGNVEFEKISADVVVILVQDARLMPEFA